MAWEAWAQSDQSTPETAVAAYEQQVNKRVKFKCDQDWITKLWLKEAPPFPPPQVCWVDHTPQTAVAADEQQQSAVAAAESYPSYRAAASLRSDGRATVCSSRIIQIEFRFLSGEEACTPMSIMLNRLLSCQEIWGHLFGCGVDMIHKKLCLDTEILDRSGPYGGRLAVFPSVHEQLQATPGFLHITVVCTQWGHLPYSYQVELEKLN